MRTSTSKSEATVLSRKKGVREEILPQVEGFKDLWVLLTSGEKMERETGRSVMVKSSYTHVWSRTLGSDRKNEIVAEMS